MASEMTQNQFIKLKLVSESGNEIHFRVKTNTKLRKVKESYNDRVGETNIRFFYDGQEIQDDDTPQSLEMEDNDVIDVYQKQVARETGELLTKNQGPSTPPPQKRKMEKNIINIDDTMRNHEKREKRELAEIERKKIEDENMFTTAKTEYLEAKRKLKEDFAEYVAVRKTFKEKLAREENMLLKKQRAIRAQASRVKREAARLEAMVRGEEEKRLDLECPVCIEEMLPPALIYGVSSNSQLLVCQPNSLPMCSVPSGVTRCVGAVCPASPPAPPAGVPWAAPGQ